MGPEKAGGHEVKWLAPPGHSPSETAVTHPVAAFTYLRENRLSHPSVPGGAHLKTIDTRSPRQQRFVVGMASLCDKVAALRAFTGVDDAKLPIAVNAMNEMMG